VRVQPGLKHMAIIILTASPRSEDVETAFSLGATSFLVKPSDLQSLASMMRVLCDWVHINHYPSFNI
jgi:CheY-like chemotaxis protein